jgi:hypothetical protein
MPFESRLLVELRRACETSKSRLLSSEWVAIMDPVALIDLIDLKSFRLQ